MELIKNILMKIVSIWQMIIFYMLALLVVVLFLVIVCIGIVAYAIINDFDSVRDLIKVAKRTLLSLIGVEEDAPE